MSVSWLVERTVDLNKGITIEPLGRLFATNDAEAHTFRIKLMESGKPVPLDGAGVFAYFMRDADKSTVVVTGSASGDVATVTLPESCYAVKSHFQIVIKVSQNVGNTRTTVYAGHGWVTRISTDRFIDPGHEIPSLDELLAKISEMEAATKAAKTATGDANAATEAAKTATENADAATEAAKQAKTDADNAREALTDQWDDVSLEYELLPPSADPWAKLEQTAHDTKLLFGLPHSNLAYSTFEVNDTMDLIMTMPDGFSDITFTLQDDGCIYLEVA